MQSSQGQAALFPALPSSLLGDLSATGPFLRSVGLTVTENLAAFLDQALPVWSPKPSHNEVEPEGPGKDKDWDIRDQLQKKTLQLQAKEKEVRCDLREWGSAHRGTESFWEETEEQGFQQLGCDWTLIGIYLPVKNVFAFRVNLSIFSLPYLYQF